MNVDKAKKRIAKQIKKGFNGYPQISLEYFGESPDCASLVVVTFTLEEGAPAQEERLPSKADARNDEVIQSAIIKIIERSDAKSVVEVAGISAL